MIKLLEKTFEGGGEVTGFKFTQIHSTEYAYLFEVTDGSTKTWYEVFKREKSAVCIDFEKRIFSETEFKERYPKAKDFGLWAWTYSKFEDAEKKLNEL